MNKLLSVAIGTLVSASIQGMEDLHSSKIIALDVATIVARAAKQYLLLKTVEELSETDRKDVYESIEHLERVRNDFMVHKQKLLNEQGQLGMLIEKLSKQQVAYETEKNCFESQPALLDERVAEITDFFSTYDENEPPPSLLVPLHDTDLITVQRRRNFKKNSSTLLYKEKKALDKIKEGFTGIINKIDEQLEPIREEKERHASAAQEKNNARTQLSAKRNGCLLLIAHLKADILNEKLTQDEQRAVTEANVIMEAVKDIPDFNELIQMKAPILNEEVEQDERGFGHMKKW